MDDLAMKWELGTAGLLILAISAVVVLLMLIMAFKVHGFLALMITSIGTALVAGIAPASLLPALAYGFNTTLGSVMLLVALGAMLGRMIETSGGAYPARLRTLLGMDRSGRRVSAPLVDWVGFDVKAAPSGYEALTGRPGAYEKARASLGLLLASGVDRELRMTVTPALCEQVPSAIDLVAELGGRALVLQRARADGAETEFAAALEAEADWHGLFADVVEAAARHGDMRGVEVAARG